MKEWDVLVIGGGPAGLMAAIGAARSGARVSLLEKGDRVGRKLLISGGGRCNVTNARGVEHILENIPGNGRFLNSALRQWSNEDIANFFTELGVQLKEEDRGRLFPVTDRSDTVLSAILSHARELAVEIKLQAPVLGLAQDSEGKVLGVRLAGDQVIRSRAVVMATGGCSVPKTGSTGDGYRFAVQVGHHIVDVYPTSVPLTANDWWVQERVLQGVSLYGVALTLYGPNAKVLCKEEGDVVLTHFGLSGPAALRVSQYAVKAFKKSQTDHLRLTISLLPGLQKNEVSAKLQAMTKVHPRRSLRNSLRELLPERLADLVVTLLGLDGDREIVQLKQLESEQIVALLLAFPMQITGTLGLEKATVTGGGVHVKEIDPTSMASKCVRGLYFAGEIMDVHAHTGGYNITVAFSTGYVAGCAAAAFASGQEE